MVPDMVSSTFDMFFALITLVVSIVGIQTVRYWLARKLHQEAQRNLDAFLAESEDTVFVLGDDGEIVREKRKREGSA